MFCSREKQPALDRREAFRTRLLDLFLNHAQMLHPVVQVTSADEWAHLHQFACIAHATYANAVDWVQGILWVEPFQRGRCLLMERISVPSLTLVEVPGSVPEFRLKFVALEQEE